jgi:hypothetical protein
MIILTTNYEWPPLGGGGAPCVLLGRQLVRRYSCDVVNSWFTIPSGPTGVHVARYDGLPHVRSIIGGDI